MKILYWKNDSKNIQFVKWKKLLIFFWAELWFGCFFSSLVWFVNGVFVFSCYFVRLSSVTQLFLFVLIKKYSKVAKFFWAFCVSSMILAVYIENLFIICWFSFWVYGKMYLHLLIFEKLIPNMISMINLAIFYDFLLSNMLLFNSGFILILSFCY